MADRTLRSARRARAASFAAALAAVAPSAASAYGVFDINLSGLESVDAKYRPAFLQAESFWEATIVGYRTSGLGALISFLDISLEIAPNDGPGGVLGSAGPLTGYDDGYFLAPDSGRMSFDSADVDNMLANGTFDAVILHEMAHVMGFGTLWTHNGVYSTGSGRYTGAMGLATYRDEFDPTATFVPVELDGGPGTANGHWDEVQFLGGRFDLMTGYLDAPTTLSRTTVFSFMDIGYLPAAAVAAVPLAPSGAMLAAGIGALVLRRRRRRRGRG